ncbi:phytochromobilin:ferredoxin oxidoreductase, chloroplastic [Tanacetum coccineum]
MESLSSSSSSLSTLFSTTFKQPYPTLSRNLNTRCNCSMKTPADDNVLSYQKFVKFALDETKVSAKGLVPSYLQEEFSTLKAVDGKTELKMCSFQAPKIRLLRSLFIESSDGMQVLDLAIFPEAEYDLPIFCANFFTTVNTNIVVLDLNPLHDAMNETHYKEKYYKSLIPLGLKYTEDPGYHLLRRLIGETLAKDVVKKFLFNGVKELGNKTFLDYFPEYKVEGGPQIIKAAHNGVPVAMVVFVGLRTCAQIGFNLRDSVQFESIQEPVAVYSREPEPVALKADGLLPGFEPRNGLPDVVKKFLFNGVKELGNKTFLDYFPEYKVEGGSINEKRSIVGKSFERRPWDTRGFPKFSYNVKQDLPYRRFSSTRFLLEVENKLPDPNFHLSGISPPVRFRPATLQYQSQLPQPPLNDNPFYQNRQFLPPYNNQPSYYQSPMGMYLPSSPSLSPQPNQGYSPINRINLDMDMENLFDSQDFYAGQSSGQGSGLPFGHGNQDY